MFGQISQINVVVSDGEAKNMMALTEEEISAAENRLLDALFWQHLLALRAWVYVVIYNVCLARSLLVLGPIMSETQNPFEEEHDP